MPYAKITPRVDASASDPTWRDAVLIPSLGLALGENFKGLSPLPTRVHLLWDENFFYTRFECRDTNPYVPFVGRDQLHYQDDVAELFLDAVGNSKYYVELEVSPTNQVLDQAFYLTTDARSDANDILRREVLDHDCWMDLGRNMTGLHTATAPLLEQGRTVGWVADFAVPAIPLLCRLGRQKFEPMTLRAHLLRYDYGLPSVNGKRPLSAMRWASVQYGCPHISLQMMGFLKIVP